jgi:hypothetical protein
MKLQDRSSIQYASLLACILLHRYCLGALGFPLGMDRTTT